ncbi:hypothetical protein JZ751_029460, partial [Albula glossodonta]
MKPEIMADGPRCKRRKQANPRRKNDKETPLLPPFHPFFHGFLLPKNVDPASWSAPERGLETRDSGNGIIQQSSPIFLIRTATPQRNPLKKADTKSRGVNFHGRQRSEACTDVTYLSSVSSILTSVIADRQRMPL